MNRANGRQSLCITKREASSEDFFHRNATNFISQSQPHKRRRSLLLIVSKQGRDVLIRVVAGFGEVVEAFAALLAKARLGEHGTPAKSCFGWGGKKGRMCRRQRCVGVPLGILFLRGSLSLFGVIGTRKQEGKPMIVGLGGCCKG